MNMDDYEKSLFLRLIDAAQDLKLFIDIQPPGTPLLISGKNVRDSRAYELAGQTIAEAKTFLTSKNPQRPGQPSFCCFCREKPMKITLTINCDSFSDFEKVARRHLPEIAKSLSSSTAPKPETGGSMKPPCPDCKKCLLKHHVSRLIRKHRRAEKRILPLRRNRSGALYIETSGPFSRGES